MPILLPDYSVRMTAGPILTNDFSVRTTCLIRITFAVIISGDKNIFLD